MAGSMIEYGANGGRAQGYLARPEGGTAGKGVIVLQEWWGLVPHIKEVADRFAAEGYVALAPDFWDGKQTKDPDEAARLFMALDIDTAEKKLRGAVAALRAQGGVQGPVGALGFCMGGQLALYAASKLADEIGACVDFYGIHPKVTPDYASLRAPVLGIFGERDEFVPVEAARGVKQAVEAAGGRCELHVYPAGHAFFNDARPEAYDAESARDAWDKVKDFLARTL